MVVYQPGKAHDSVMFVLTVFTGFEMALNIMNQAIESIENHGNPINFPIFAPN
jgi:hypothetical protein